MVDDFDKKAALGEIWIHERNDKIQLKVVVNGRQLTGFKNYEKGDNQKAPDYWLVEYSEADRQEVGAAWRGVTEHGSQKLSFKLDEHKFFTAVMVKNPFPDEADMKIFKSSEEEMLEVASQEYMWRQQKTKKLRNAV